MFDPAARLENVRKNPDSAADAVVPVQPAAKTHCEAMCT